MEGTQRMGTLKGASSAAGDDDGVDRSEVIRRHLSAGAGTPLYTLDLSKNRPFCQHLLVPGLRLRVKSVKELGVLSVNLPNFHGTSELLRSALRASLINLEHRHLFSAQLAATLRGGGGGGGCAAALQALRQLQA